MLARLSQARLLFKNGCPIIADCWQIKAFIILSTAWMKMG